MKHSKTALLAIILAASIAVPAAQSRVDTTRMSCRQAQNTVQSRGAIVMSTGRNTFDRFVVDRSFCPPGDYIKRAYVPTRDQKACSVGYTCTMDNPWEPWND